MNQPFSRSRCGVLSKVVVAITILNARTSLADVESTNFVGDKLGSAVTWSGAESHCQSTYQTHLASVNGEGDWSEMKQMFDDINCGSDERMFLGGFYNDSSEEWEQIDGTEWWENRELDSAANNYQVMRDVSSNLIMDEVGSSQTLTCLACNIPTNSPTTSPTSFSAVPTNNPTSSPTQLTSDPTTQPTKSPTQFPTDYPTLSPTTDPTTHPTGNPTEPPTENPTFTRDPSTTPTKSPSKSPSIPPTRNPTQPPTKSPSDSPTLQTMSPSLPPTLSPIPNPGGSGSAKSGGSSIDDSDLGLILGICIPLFLICGGLLAYMYFRVRHLESVIEVTNEVSVANQQQQRQDDNGGGVAGAGDREINVIDEEVVVNEAGISGMGRQNTVDEIGEGAGSETYIAGLSQANVIEPMVYAAGADASTDQLFGEAIDTSGVASAAAAAGDSSSKVIATNAIAETEGSKVHVSAAVLPVVAGMETDDIDIAALDALMDEQDEKNESSSNDDKQPAAAFGQQMVAQPSTKTVFNV